MLLALALAFQVGGLVDVPVCAPLYHLGHATECAATGPGYYSARMVAQGGPFRPTPLQLQPVPPVAGLTPHAYGKVITDLTPIYRHPNDALMGLSPVRTIEKGFVYVSLLARTEVSGTTFYQVNPGEFVAGDILTEARPSRFQGIYNPPPGATVGWVIANAPTSPAPGAPPNFNSPQVGRYQAFQVLATQRVGDWDWYLIGPDQWIEQRLVALVHGAPPPGAPADVIAVDTYEQSLGVYRGGQLILATLISSGSRLFPTRPGTFSIWAKIDYARMTGAYLRDRRDFYYVDDVPWTLYYDGDRALHGAYWHDNFGMRSSHGCVNLSPRDSRWLFNFANVGDTVVIFSSR